MRSNDGGAQHAAAQRTGRKLVDMAQKARGRTPLKYEMTIIPFFCGELPSGLDKLSFVWERGSKVFATEAEPVNPHTKACFWQQYLKQTATVYQDSGVFVPKEYVLKVQSVKSRRGGGEDRRTVGKVRVDLAQFCNAEVEPLPKEVFFQLKPVGKLKVSIKAGWLKDAVIDDDSLTEASFFTQRSTEGGGLGGRSGGGGGEDEQDLSGFEGAVHGHAGGAAGGGRSSALGLPDGRAGSASPLGRPQQQRAGAQPGAKEGGVESPAGSAHGGSPRIPAGAGARQKLPGEIPQFAVPLSPEEQREELERQKRKVMEAAEQHIAAMKREMEDALRTELALALESQQNVWWRRMCCCCWPRAKAPYARPESQLAGTADPGQPATEGGAMVPPTCADL